jgi:hypothetical protein
MAGSIAKGVRRFYPVCRVRRCDRSHTGLAIALLSTPLRAKHPAVGIGMPIALGKGIAMTARNGFNPVVTLRRRGRFSEARLRRLVSRGRRRSRSRPARDTAWSGRNGRPGR